MNNILLVANWKSDVGYAWWLMENFWVRIAGIAASNNARAFLIYPEINAIPDTIATAPITVDELDYRDHSAAGLWRLLRYIRANGIRHLYLTDKSYVSPGYLLLRLAGIRTIIVHDHTPGERTIPRGFKRSLKRLRASLPWVTADHMIAVTGYVRRRHLDALCIPARKCHIAQNGIAPIGRDPALANHAHQAFGIPEHCLIILTSGRANRYKRIDFIIECANSLIHQDKRDDVIFLYCGDGPDLTYFKGLANRYGLGSRFLFAGMRKDIREIAQSCHIGIQASRGEVGYSLSILEYMSAGLATVVPDNPSVCGAIIPGETGLVFQEAGLESACQQLRRLLDEPALRERLGQQASKSVADRFNIIETNRQFTHLISDLLLAGKDG